MKIWSKLPLIILALVLGLLPFFLAFPNPEFNLSYLLFSAVAIFLFYDLINLGREKKIVINTSPFGRAIVLLLLSFLISTILGPNKAASLLSPLGLGILIVLSIWYVLLSNILSIKKINILPIVVLITASLLSVFIILDNLSVFKLLNLKLYELYKLSNFTNFTTDPYVSLSFLLPILIILGYCLWQHLKINNFNYSSSDSEKFSLRSNNKKTLKIVFSLLSFFLLLTASLLLLPFPASVKTSNGTPSSTFSTLSTCSTCVLPYQSGWSISLDALKNPKSAIAGYGVGNFPVAFNLNRPFGLNGSFPRSSNFFLQLLTENGILGLLAFLYLLFLAFKETKLRLSLRGVLHHTVRDDEAISSTFSACHPELDSGSILIDSRLHGNDKGENVARNDTLKIAFLGFWSTVILMFLLPPNLILLFYFFTFLGLIPHLGGVPSATSEVKNTPKTYDLSNLENTIWVVSGTLIFLICLIVYLAGRAYLAEVNYQKGLAAIAKNEKVGPVYNLLKSATDLNPYLPKYHQTLSQTMLFWGTSLTKKDTVTDKDRQDATTLIQQSIAQAQQAIAQNPQDSSAWQNLGEIYRTIISSVNGADSWAATALIQAVSLNPNFSQSHFALAGLYIQLSQWENAKRQLEASVTLDPGFANGFYNLYYVQKQQGLFAQALTSLNQAISLLPANSDQNLKLQTEKSALEKLVPQATPTPLVPRSLGEGGKLNLPQTASPPAHFKP